MKSDLLNILACPQCQGSLIYLNDQDLLICKVEALSFPIRDDIPLLTMADAQSFNVSDLIKAQDRG